MKSFSENLEYSDQRVVISVILETAFSKEIRILMKAGQRMKEHKAPYPIIIHVLEGAINFGVEGETTFLEKGTILSLDGNTMHDLTAKEDSVIRLSLSKLDSSIRVKIAANS